MLAPEAQERGDELLHGVHARTLGLWSIDHGVLRELAKALVGYKAQVVRMGFGDGDDGGAVHPREKIWAKGAREPSLVNFDVALSADEVALTLRWGRNKGIVVR